MKNEAETILETSNEESTIAQFEIETKFAEIEKERDNFKDQLLRKVAEFENFKRRNSEERTSLIKFANEQLILELLPIVDDFQRSMQQGKDVKNFETLYSGIELIANKLNKLLDAKGVKSFNSIGEMFNVNLHDVLMSIPKNDVADHTIVEEVLRGYMLNEKVLRHAKVIVAENQTTEEN